MSSRVIPLLLVLVVSAAACDDTIRDGDESAIVSFENWDSVALQDDARLVHELVGDTLSGAFGFESDPAYPLGSYWVEPGSDCFVMTERLDLPDPFPVLDHWERTGLAPMQLGEAHLVRVGSTGWVAVVPSTVGWDVRHGGGSCDPEVE